MGVCEKCCRCVVCGGNFLQSFFLLAIRILWGGAFIFAGLQKFMDINGTAQFFQSLGLPAASLTAYLVATVETVGGACLLVGFASRLAAIPLAIVMITALLTAHKGATYALLADFSKFSVQTPIPFLLTSLTVLCFGPGVFSVDALIKRCCCSSSCSSNK